MLWMPAGTPSGYQPQLRKGSRGKLDCEGIQRVSNLNALYDAFEKSRKGSDWKLSVQRYWYDIWPELHKTKKALETGAYRQKPYVEFDLCDRGKKRHIKSVHISDRVVQRSLCDNVLTPTVMPYLIYDNGASQLYKGVDFTRRRLEHHLHKFYRTYGDNDGYIVLVDFKNYFSSIPHDKLKEVYARIIPEPDLRALINYLIDTSNGTCGMGIGSQVSQNAGIFYPTPIDQYFKTVRAEKFYAAYMDDRYIICRTKAHAKECLADMRIKAAELGLQINDKKTQIVKLSTGFTFLKIRYILTDTGKVVKYQNKSVFVRERRRLKKFKAIGMPPERASTCYRSWRGTALQYKNNYHRIRRMDALFEELYPGAKYKAKGRKT